MTMPLWQRTALEAFGTGFLAFTVGRLGSSEFNGFEQAIVIGLCLAMLIHLMGRATGAHFNPAVTLLPECAKVRPSKAPVTGCSP